MVNVSSMVFPLTQRIRQIDVALVDCADDAKRQDLETERRIKGELLQDLLDAAVPVKRNQRRKEQLS